MRKPWLGFISSALFLLAGILQMVAGKYLIGALFFAVSIASVIVHIKMNKRSDQ